MKLLVAAILALAAFAANAQTVNADSTISWLAPTTAQDGSPLVGSLAVTSYNVFVSTAAVPDTATTPTVTLTGAALSYITSIPAKPNDTLHVRVQACNIGGCGPLTPEVTKSISVPTPGVPTNVTVAIQIKP